MELMRGLNHQSESRRVNQPLICLRYLGTSQIHQKDKYILFNPFYTKKGNTIFILRACLENLTHRSQASGWEPFFLTILMVHSLAAAKATLKGKADGTTLIMSC